MTTDVCGTEQLNLSIRWVSDEYKVLEDSIAFFHVPDTKFETLYKVIIDILNRCNLPVEMCRGQAYDSAANMQGRRAGVAAKIHCENNAAIPVHCLVHSLNLCFQGVGKSITFFAKCFGICERNLKFNSFRDSTYSYPN